MSFEEAMNKYGSDKPDTRFDVFLQDFTEIFKKAEPCVFREMAEAGQTIRGFMAPGVSYSRKVLDDLTNYVKQMGAAGLAWIKPTSEGLSSAPVVKNAGAAAIDAASEAGRREERRHGFPDGRREGARPEFDGSVATRTGAPGELDSGGEMEHVVGRGFPAARILCRRKPLGFAPPSVYFAG